MVQTGAFLADMPIELTIAVDSLFANDNVLYHLLLGLGTMQQVSGSVLRPSEASAFVNTCRLPVTNRGKRTPHHFRVANNRSGTLVIISQNSVSGQLRHFSGYATNREICPRHERAGGSYFLLGQTCERCG